MTSSLAAAPIDWDEKRLQLMGQRDSRALPPWVKLPALSSALTEFVKKAQDPDIGAGKLARVIEKDCGLTSLLLKTVNSSASGFKHKAKTAQEAIVRLGIRASSLLLTTAQMNQLMKSSQSTVVNARGFFCSNLERALFARRVARLWKLDEELAFAGAMLCDCLLPVLTNEASDVYFRLIGIEKNPPQICQFETNEFGWTHAEAAAYLFAAWEFPSDLVCCVLLHHKALDVLKDESLRSTAIAAVAIAGLLPDQLRQEPGGLELLEQLQAADARFDMTALATDVAEDFRETEPGLENPFPLLRRLKTRR